MGMGGWQLNYTHLAARSATDALPGARSLGAGDLHAVLSQQLKAPFLVFALLGRQPLELLHGTEHLTNILSQFSEIALHLSLSLGLLDSRSTDGAGTILTLDAEPQLMENHMAGLAKGAGEVVRRACES